MTDVHPSRNDPDVKIGRRQMDRQLDEMRDSLTRLDEAIRGNGRPGLVRIVDRLQERSDRHAERLDELATVPATLEDLKRKSDERDAVLVAVQASLKTIEAASKKAATAEAAEALAIDKVRRWLKTAAVVLAAVGVGGGVTLVQLLDATREVYRALGGTP